MSKNNGKNALPLPGENRKTSIDFLPRFFKTEANKKFLQSTLDQLIQPGVAEKLNSYFGRKTAKAFIPSDSYISDVTDQRQNYQLEPALTIKDDIDNVVFYKDYNDYINQISAFGGDVSNHSLINRQESYGWNPNIDWDKIVNYRDYYWLPNGPVSVPVRGQNQEVISTYSVTLTGIPEAPAYLFSPNSLTSNPRLTLYRGQKYRFDIDTPGYPIAFAISRTVVPGTALLVAGREGIRGPGLYDSELYDVDNYDIGDFIVPPDPGSISFELDENVSTLYDDGIRKFNEDGEEIAVVFIEKGTIEFTIPFNSPDRLFYISKNDINVSGIITVANIEENTFLNVQDDILGKKTYLSANGVEFSNGQKVKFTGTVLPEKFSEGDWYVEGVGSSITLIRDRDLIIPAQYSQDISVPFDSEPFDILPFSDASGFARDKDYIVIHRASNDRNSWSRYNKWFHRQIIEQSAKINNLPFDLDEESRAKRPIIEFEPGLRLYDYGTFAKNDVDLIDTFTKDVFSVIEGSIGYNVDGIDLSQGMRVLFAADTDRLVNGRIFSVNFIEIDGERQISLVETEDSEPLELETVFVKQGNQNAGKTFYFRDSTWKLAQEKNKTNQPPLFDLCCPSGREFSDLSIFDSSSFTGTKVFSYKQGCGPIDTELGFPIEYRNINNTGDIVFEFNLLTDSFTIQQGDDQRVINTDTAYLRKYTSREDFVWVNGYSSIPTSSEQPVLQQIIVDENELRVFEINTYENAASIDDLRIRVFVNNRFNKKDLDYLIDRIDNRLFVRFLKDLSIDDVILIKTLTNTPKNSNGFYEFPYNLERNPNNEDPQTFTLGEISDHVQTMVEKIPEFKGDFPGSSNIRDLGETDHYGSRFVKHSGPINLPLYHLTHKDYNLVKAVRYSKNEYSKFKRNFIRVSSELGFDGPTKQHVDKILVEVNKDRVKTEPFYFSDMLAYGDSNLIEYKIVDKSNKFYSLSEQFSLKNLSPRSVLVYLNDQLLTAQKHYSFNDEGFLILEADQKEGDNLLIYEYESTDGSYIPPTPSKLGLYPKFVPEILLDDTYIAGNLDDAVPYKIYGQIKNEQIGWFYPVYSSRTLAKKNHPDENIIRLEIKGLSNKVYIPESQSKISKQDTDLFEEYPLGISMVRGHDGSYVKAFKDYRDKLLLEFELRIFNNIKVDYDSGFLDINDFVGGFYRNTGFSKDQIDNSLLTDFIQWLNIVDEDYTENNFYNRQNKFTYNYSNMTSPDGTSLPGFWRGIYIQAYDTDRPHTAPWEMLGFSIKPDWWNTVYGDSPYTSDNLILWEDLEAGIVREPNKPVTVRQKYARPGLTDFIPVDSNGNLKSPLDSGFSQNFFFRFLQQNFKFGDHSPVETAWRRSSEYPFSLINAWLLNNPAKLLGLGFDVSRIRRNFANQIIYTETGKPIQIDKLLLPNTVEDSSRIQTSGLVNYIYNLIASNVLSVYDDYRSQLKRIQNNLGIKIGGFTEKNKFRLLLDSRSPQQSLEASSFVPEENYNIFLNTSSAIEVVNYSGVLIQKTAAGFVVRGYNQTEPFFKYFEPIKTARDITFTVGGVSERTVRWQPNRPYSKGQVLENNNNFFRVIRDFVSGNTFDINNLSRLEELPIVGGRRAQIARSFEKRKTLILPYGTRLNTTQDVVDFILGYAAYLTNQGFNFNYVNPQTDVVENWEYSIREFLFWTTQGWADGTTISLSPASAEINFRSEFSVVDDLYNGFYDYSILKSDGRPLEPEFNNVYREQNTFTLRPVNTDDGIYNIKLPLVQKEHVVILDNKTIFNDLIYQPSSGYRQERIKVLGYRTDEWNGSLNIPGFIFDEVSIKIWQPWRDYNIGDVVKHKEFFYIAKENTPGSLIFEDRFWIRLNEKPESRLLTNFDYRINQFTDFYDLDSDNFDIEQQKLAQHLIGYQKRKYLENIIKDDVSQFKFYQGYIREKGSFNSIRKLFDSINNSDESVDLYEEWAIQVGQYGAVDNFEQIEIQIDDSRLRESPQSFELVEQLPLDIFDNAYRIRPFELYEKPLEYNSNPFPTVDKIEEYLPTDGYVDLNTVSYRVENKIELANADANQIEISDYIWLLDDGRESWTVLQYSESIARAESLTDNQLVDEDNLPLWTFTVDRWASNIVEPGDFIAIKAAQRFGVFGFYEVESVNFNRITVRANENNVFAEFENQSFIITKLRPVRVADLDQLNNKVQSLLTVDQKIWVDKFDEKDNWAVLQNTPQYNKQQEIINPRDFDSTRQEFGEVFDVTDDNRNLFISASGDEDGKVFYYRRTETSTDFVNNQIISPSSSFFNTDNSKFGKAVAISPDGKFLVVGAPNSSDVKTRYKGIFDSNTEYNKNDIVKFRETLWRANRKILPRIDNQSFETFNSYIKLNETTDLDSTTIRLMFVGNLGLPNLTTDHILLRAPLDQYLGSKEGDTVFLTWNTVSYTNNTLDQVFPFDNKITAITPDFISRSQGHEISKKVDMIVFVRNYINLPSVGQIVTTNTGSAQVLYVGATDNDLVLYLNDIKGTISVIDDLFIDNDLPIGRYSQEKTFVNEDAIGGFWLIETPNYNNQDLVSDAGRGLIFKDLIPSEIARDINFYFNIQKTVFDVGPIFNENLRASKIQHLTYQGNPGEVFATQKSNLWLFRASQEMTDALSIDDEFEFRLLEENISLEGTGFNFNILNKTQTVKDIWDGYIDFTFNNFDFAGLPFEPVIGDIIEDVQTPFGALTSSSTSRAKIVFYQRNLNNVRVYLKVISGNWQQLNNIARYEIRRLGNVQDPGTGNIIRPSEPNRIIGIVNDVSNSIILETASIGKFIVLEADDDFELASVVPEITNGEYFIFQTNTELGIGRSENPPYSLNRDYTQVYHISADQFGNTDPNLENEGVISIFRRLRNGQYRLTKTIVSEYRMSNKKFGSQIRFAKQGELYKLFVSSEGDKTSDNFGSIEIFYHGPEDDSRYKGVWQQFEEYNAFDVVEFNGDFYEALRPVINQDERTIFDTVFWKNISWRSAKDRNYRGEFDNSYPYKEDSIVFKDDKLYRAITNISAGESFDLAVWKELDQKIDYLGYLPNLTGLKFYDQNVWDPDQNIEQFSESFDVSKNGSVLVVTSKQVSSDSTTDKSVLVYRQKDDKYLLSQAIPAPDNINKFADQVKIRPDGEFIAISETENDDKKIDQGKVYIFQQINGNFDLVQELLSPNNEINEKFGYSMSFGDENLVIASLNGDMKIPTAFDQSSGSLTTFDRGFTDFSSTKKDSGVVYVYENIKDKMVFAESLEFSSVKNRFGQRLLSNQNHVYVAMPQQGDTDNKGLVLEYKKPKFTKSWKVIQEFVPPVDVQKIKSIFLYNKRTNQKIIDIDYIDPVQGKIASIAEREIDYKTSYDPAFYTNGIVSNLVNPDQAWKDNKVGTVWWNINSVKFAYPYFGNLQYQKINWNQIPSNAEVEVYEWVKSSVIPSEWDRISLDDPDNEQGISGQSRYGDNFFSQKFIYDNEAKSFRSEYYFWVRNKISIPRTSKRRISVFDIRRIIEDPRGQKYRYINLLSSNRFVLNNCEEFLTNDDVILSIQYRSNSSETQNRHIQYQLLSDGSETSKPHPDIEKKWFHSLIGFDDQSRKVPDEKISIKQKYGVQNEPRQSMFVNREEALKQYIERVNLTLKNNLIVDEYDITPLESKELIPSTFSGVFDLKIETDDELRFVSTLKVEQAKLEPVIINGRISRIRIVNPGKGYRIPPVLEVIGTGSDSQFDTVINDLGEIVDVKIIQQGFGYDETTEIKVRSFSVLVENDSQSRGKWSVYHWNNNTRSWDRALVQAFDVSLYWDYIDWYDEGYNEFTPIDYKVKQTFKIDQLDSSIGDIIKIESIGSGGWLLMEKIADEETDQFSTNYKVVGRQQGTIQFSDSLYDFKKNSIGYNNRAYDSFLYDNIPIRELMIIFETIRDNIFIGKLSREYNQLFVSSLRYILNEQLYVDWLFKTSFIKINHTIGNLEQKINFEADSLEDYQKYVEEVKPYSTNIREFVTTYLADDNTNSKVTDFDLAPIYNRSTKSIEVSQSLIFDNQLVNTNESIKEQQNQNWFNNFAYKVREIKIVDPGEGYTLKPIVRIEGGGGTGAKAEAFLGYGKITRILITDPGEGYLSAPEIIIEGSISENGSPAKAIAVIGDSLVRNFDISMKFDRIFGKYYFETLDTVEQFKGTNVNNVFELEWPVDLNKKSFRVFQNGRQLLRSEYTVSNIENFDKSYKRHKGQIVFTKTPELDDHIRVEYRKSINLLSAEDRIQFGYNPTIGMPGQDLGQLMEGVDYGGVEVKSFDFEKTEGWDIDGWDENSWDTFDDTIEDEIFVFDGSTTSIDLSKPLEKNVDYNFYLNDIRIDDPKFNTSEQTNDNAIINTITGDGETQQIDIANLNIFVSDGDELVIRKITSDGSFKPNTETYDLDLSGGDLLYKSAKGINAEEIIVDGDGFVTPTTSKGPEELIPGQILDALDVRVFTRTADGQGLIYNQNHKISQNRTYDLGVVPNSGAAVLVKVDRIVLSESDYSINWDENSVTIDDSIIGDNLNIITMSQTAKSIIDFGKVVFDSSTLTYDTDIKFDQNYTIVALYKGERVDIEFFENTDSKTLAFSFNEIKNDNDVINYIVFNRDIETNYSQVTKDQFVSDGSTTEFELSSVPFFAEPTLVNVIVKADNDILSSGYNVKFIIPQSMPRRYDLEKFQIEQGSLQTEDLKLFVNGKEIFAPVDWIFDSFENAIFLQGSVGLPGDLLEIFAIGTSDYSLTENKLVLKNVVEQGKHIEVFKFSNHDILGIDRINYDLISRITLDLNSQENTTYQRLSKGEISLRNPALEVQYVWVTLNKQLLVPSVDYYLTDQKSKVQLTRKLQKNDQIEIIHFSAPEATSTFEFRQFKDMLNRTHYKKITAPQTVLTKDLNYYDLRIEVQDTSNLSEPNKSINQPGVVFIDGERIEYFVKENNLLRQLRRGTLGTGVKQVHQAGTPVFDQSSNKTIPYKDRSLTQNILADSSVKEYMFAYEVSSIDEIEVFVLGKRLKKLDTTKFDPSIAQDSPEGDIIDPADFELGYEIILDNQFVIGEFKPDEILIGSNDFKGKILSVQDSGNKTIIRYQIIEGQALPSISVRVFDNENTETGFGIVDQMPKPVSIIFRNNLNDNDRITIIKKIGKLWSDMGIRLQDAQNDIADFLKNNKV